MATPAPPETAPPDRLLSIDALRGLDMLVIMGADEVVRLAARRSSHPLAATIADQFEHVEWQGFRFYDLIFPLFLFLVGTVLPFSLGKLFDRGEPRGKLYARIARRTLLLFALGLLCNDVLQFHWPMRVAGVLQRIGICYGLAALIYLNTNRPARIVVLAAILLGYWAVLSNVAAPDSKAGDYSIEGNLAGWVDRHYLPGKIMKPYYGFGDNEGLLSTIPAVGTALLGVLAGEWLRSSRGGGVKVLGLLIAGAASLLAGTAWGHSFPIIKNLWTSSFVLVAGGWSLMLLGAFHGVIDVMRFRRWCFPLVVIGANAITVYVVPRFVDFDRMARFFLGGTLRFAGDDYAPIVLALGALAAEWLFLLFLYRHRIFLRV